MIKRERAEPLALEEFCAWQGRDLRASEAHLATLDASAEREILQAVVSLRGKAQPELRRADVPLAKLTARLAQWRDAVVFGRGFVLLRRLPIERVNDADAGLLFAALAAHLGRACPQDGESAPVADLRSGEVCGPLASDPADLTALLCMSAPAGGFELTLSSAVAVHNTLAAEEPGLLAALYEPAAPGLGQVPAFMQADGRLFARFAPDAWPKGTCQKSRAAARAAQLAAEGALALDFEPGDVLVVNNHHIYYGLSAAKGPAGGRVLRLRLESQLIGARPAAYADREVWLGLTPQPADAQAAA